MSCRVLAIIQARMASSRLPGKVLLDIAGQPMLARVHARTSRAERVDEVLVATTTDPSDDPVAAFCEAHSIPHARGSQFDVLDRYYQAALLHPADVIVRVTADCPAIDPALIDDAVATLLGESEGCAPAFDFVANRLPPPFHRSFPIGLDVEVCTFAAMERARTDGHEPGHREHVMPYLYEGVKLARVSPELESGTSPRGFRVGLRNHVPDLGALRWTVDTPEDLEFMRQVYARFAGRDDFTWEQLLELVQHEPELAAINSAVRHKTLGEVDERAAKR
jgi:spore coat polysaccharide biosynthesis protein SpsF